MSNDQNGIVTTNESVLIFALRYSMERATSAGWLVAKEIQKTWDSLSCFTQADILRSIERAIQFGECKCEGDFREVRKLVPRKQVASVGSAQERGESS